MTRLCKGHVPLLPWWPQVRANNIKQEVYIKKDLKNEWIKRQNKSINDGRTGK